jgi:hypothetical protein
MLYTRVMSTKPNVPGEILLGASEYSWRSDCSVNGWLAVAALISGCFDIIFPTQFAACSLAWRITVVLAQFVALALWVRSLMRWIRGMDEMHRRITTSAVLFAVSATFFVVLFWQRLESAGVINALTPDHIQKHGTWNIATVAHSFLLMTLFYIFGHHFFSRRYR